jgi:ribosomal protein S18 acetylase RimI-like enzyme
MSVTVALSLRRPLPPASTDTGMDEADEIRLAGSADLDTVRTLVHDAYVHYVARIGKPPGPMLDDYARRIAAAQTWLLERDRTPLGLVVLEDHDGFLLLDNVAVAPAAQGQGLGRKLIDFAQDEAVRRGYSEIRLYTHALMVENIALYQRLGFIEIQRVREKGFDRVYMVKHVAR